MYLYVRYNTLVMKKMFFAITVMGLGSAMPAYAGTGSAGDGLWFMLILAGSLLLLAALLKGIDYLDKNGRLLIRFTRMKFRKAFHLLQELLTRNHPDLLSPAAAA